MPADAVFLPHATALLPNMCMHSCQPAVPTTLSPPAQDASLSWVATHFMAQDHPLVAAMRAAQVQLWAVICRVHEWTRAANIVCRGGSDEMPQLIAAMWVPHHENPAHHFQLAQGDAISHRSPPKAVHYSKRSFSFAVVVGASLRVQCAGVGLRASE